MELLRENKVGADAMKKESISVRRNESSIYILVPGTQKKGIEMISIPFYMKSF